MKLTHALASGSLLFSGSAIDPKRVKHNLRYIENESAKTENDVERFLFDAESMSMAAATQRDDILMGGKPGGAKSGKGGKGEKLMDFFFVGHEECVDAEFNRYDSIAYVGIDGEGACERKCGAFTTEKLIGLEYTPAARWCMCLFEDDYLDAIECPIEAAVCSTCPEGKGEVKGTEIGSVVLKGGPLCYRYGPPGLKPSSYTDFNEDAISCTQGLGQTSYNGLSFTGGEGSPYGDIDSPEKCAVQCADAGVVNLVGFDYLAYTRSIPVERSESIDVMLSECACLVPKDAADCSGWESPTADVWDRCADSFNLTGPVSFVLGREYAIARLEANGLQGVTFTNTKCIRNDNFDPNEPTLGVSFPATGRKKSTR